MPETQALATLGVSIRRRGSGVPLGQRLFSIVRVCDGKIIGIADHTERHRALEAAGLSE